MVVPNYPSGSEALCDVSEHPFLQCEVVSLTPNTQAGGPLLVAVHDCLFNIFAANLHIWRPTPTFATQGTRYAVVTGTHGWGIFSRVELFNDFFTDCVFCPCFVLCCLADTHTAADHKSGRLANCILDPPLQVIGFMSLVVLEVKLRKDKRVEQ